jgi:hypothetical protein
MGTNFLSLPSSGFTGLRPKQQPAPSHGFLPCINNISACDFNQQFLFLTEMSLYTNTIISTLTAVPATVIFADFLCPFHGLIALRPKGSLKGIRLLIIANHPEYREAPGALLGVLVVGFFCLPSKLTGGVL